MRKLSLTKLEIPKDHITIVISKFKADTYIIVLYCVVYPGLLQENVPSISIFSGHNNFHVQVVFSEQVSKNQAN